MFKFRPCHTLPYSCRPVTTGRRVKSFEALFTPTPCALGAWLHLCQRPKGIVHVPGHQSPPLSEREKSLLIPGWDSLATLIAHPLRSQASHTIGLPAGIPPHTLEPILFALHGVKT